MEVKESKYFDTIFNRFWYGPHFFYDRHNTIIKNAIINVIKSKDFSINFEKEIDEKYFELRYEEYFKKFNDSKPLEINLVNADGEEAQLLYFNSSNPAGIGSFFFVNSKENEITEFTRYEKECEDLPKVIVRDGFNRPFEVHQLKFGTVVTTLKTNQAGLFVNTLTFNNIYNPARYPLANTGEISLELKHYDFDTDGMDITSTPMIFHTRVTPNLRSSGVESRVKIILEKLKSKNVKPGHVFKMDVNDCVFEYNLDNERRDLTYLKKAVFDNVQLFESYVADIANSEVLDSEENTLS